MHDFCSVLSLLFKVILSVLITLSAHQAFSWSAKGHAFISEHSMATLTRAQITHLNKLANSLNIYGGFEQLPVWPDKIRDTSLKDIFGKQSVSTPSQLKSFSKYNTNDWHYSNHYVFTSNRAVRSCKTKKRGRLREKLSALHRTLILHASGKERLNLKQEAIVLALFLHLLQDLHQPMHLLSQVDDKCSSDLGGNKACVYKKKPFVRFSKNRCRNNLHSIWDQGFGAFKQTLPRVKTIEYTMENFEQQVDDWVEKSRRLSDAVYGLENAKSFDAYRTSSKGIVQEQLSLGVNRSSIYLKNYFNFNSNTYTDSIESEENSFLQKLLRLLKAFVEA